MSISTAETPVGMYVPIEGGRAFVPHPLPRAMELDSPTVQVLDRASRAIGVLAGIGEMLPNPHLLIRPFISREAVLSSRIEGTQTLVSDLFLSEATDSRLDPHGDAREVMNYVDALDHGLAALSRLPLSVRLFNEIHAKLMEGVRGEDKRPGELRQGQVIVGPRSASIRDALFVPPPASYVRDLLTDLEHFINSDTALPPLVECALTHYQFETIHPYLDGNGRIGRLIIVLFLCQKGVLPTPLLYLSAYLERNRDAYYGELNNLRESGDWSSWLRFFLAGIEEQALDAVARSRRMLELQRRYSERLMATRASVKTMALLDKLFVSPFITRGRAQKLIAVSARGAKGIIDRLCDEGILEVHPGVYPTTYVARELLHVIEAPTAAD